MTDADPGRLTADELSQRLGVESGWVDALAEAGVIARGPDGRFAAGDLHRVRLLLAFDQAGIPFEALLAASRSGRISLDYYDELHAPPGVLSKRTYASSRRRSGPTCGSSRGCSRRSGSPSPTRPRAPPGTTRT